MRPNDGVIEINAWQARNDMIDGIGMPPLFPMIASVAAAAGLPCVIVNHVMPTPWLDGGGVCKSPCPRRTITDAATKQQVTFHPADRMHYDNVAQLYLATYEPPSPGEDS